MSDTIFALATAAGRAGVAVVRLSGPGCDRALSALTGQSRLPARRLELADFCDPATGSPIDRGMAVWFGKPASYTGEDMMECHLHGSPAVVASMLNALGKLPGLRLAEPGEFTRRAFENGKLDLTEAEAVADLIQAETTAQQRQALRQLGGELSRLYDGWRDRLARALAHAEAVIDFSDEELPDNLDRTVREAVERLIGEIDCHLADNRRGERLRDGLRIAIVGAPNVGKSTLLNALAQRDVAIVSARAGTTRDIIEVHLDLGGYPVLLADTAGIRATDDEIEGEGVRRARAWADTADLKLVLVEGAEPDTAPEIAGLIDVNAIVVATKADLAPTAGGLAVSAKTGQGMTELVARLTAAAERLLAPGEMPNVTRVRHRNGVEHCRAALARSLAAGSAELVAEDLRLAMRELGRIAGRVDVEDLLDIIFREFCIGK
ncbi:MAG: tRNA uridine-5-carboxymethylaminomethyl(34) synthesis GTPase MnmE [Alphaproteobacteria bacterium]|nr:tRNA uridine-5-carboxymethylaminomethyl(34) synthesis GTPase MnmE [Alphaproteobacteria bacterium]